MGYCERKVLLQHLHGPKVAASRAAAQQRGIIAHQRFLMESLRRTPQADSDGDCGIARLRLTFVASRPQPLFERLLRYIVRWRR